SSSAGSLRARTTGEAPHLPPGTSRSATAVRVCRSGAAAVGHAEAGRDEPGAADRARLETLRRGRLGGGRLAPRPSGRSAGHEPDRARTVEALAAWGAHRPGRPGARRCRVARRRDLQARSVTTSTTTCVVATAADGFNGRNRQEGERMRLTRTMGYMKRSAEPGPEFSFDRLMGELINPMGDVSRVPE